MSLLTRATAFSHPEAPARRWAVLVVVCASALIVNVDNTILNVALPTLVRDLHATSSQLQWIVDSYAMVFAGLLLVGGSLADRFGRKRLFLLGLTVFAGASVGAALSGSVDLSRISRDSTVPSPVPSPRVTVTRQLNGQPEAGGQPEASDDAPLDAPERPDGAHGPLRSNP